MNDVYTLQLWRARAIYIFEMTPATIQFAKLCFVSVLHQVDKIAVSVTMTELARQFISNT